MSCGLCGRMPRDPSIIVNDGGVENDGGEQKYPNKTWMGDLVASNPSFNLKRMIIPGSHNAATYSIPSRKVGSAIGKTQNLSIREQLLSGIRFLDLRIASNGKSGKVCTFHNRLMGCTFKEVLDQIRDFCNDYPAEFVVVYIQKEYGRDFFAKDKVRALELMRSHFGSLSTPTPKRLLCKASHADQVVNTPLKLLIPQRGRVCVIINPGNEFYKDFVIKGVDYNPDYVEKEYGFYDKNTWLKDKWHDTFDAMELKERNLSHVRSNEIRLRKQFVCNQFVLTPDFGSSSLQPVKLANKCLYQPPSDSGGRGVPFLHQIMLDDPDEDWNILSLDFVDLAPAAIRLLIGMNFGSLEIELALLGGARVKDVTDDVRRNVLRESCLFLHPKHDFDNEESSSLLTIVYKISHKFYTIVMDLTLTDVVVLNQHNHLRSGGTQRRIGTRNETNGTIKMKSGVTVTWEKTKGQTIRFDYRK